MMLAEEITVGRDGDALVFDEALYREVAPGLWRAILIYAGRRDIADDAVAEAFTRAMESFTEIRDPKAWLYRVAFRAAASELHNGHRLEPPIDDVPIEEPIEVRPVLDALGQLPPNQRAAMIMHYRLDLSVREIARALSISPATVKVHLHRGRNRLREILGDDDA